MNLPNFSNKSLRWAFAELLVVVAGILIAFQIEEVRTELSDRALERDLLNNFRRDLENDQRQLERFLQASETNAQFSFDYRQYLRSDQMRSIEELTKFPEIRDGYVFRQASPTYTGWRDSARPDLISNTEIRDLLFDYYEVYSPRLNLRIERLEAAYDDFAEATYLDWDSVLIRDENSNELVLNVFPIEPFSDMPRHPDFYDRLDLWGREALAITRRSNEGLRRIQILQTQILEHENNL